MFGQGTIPLLPEVARVEISQGIEAEVAGSVLLIGIQDGLVIAAVIQNISLEIIA